jgi:hypothetical protein
MIKPLSQLTNFASAINQEGNAQPGESLSVLETFTYFVAAPVLVFAVIAVIAWFASAPKKAKAKGELTQSSDEDNSFITFIA